MFVRLLQAPRAPRTEELSLGRPGLRRHERACLTGGLGKAVEQRLSQQRSDRRAEAWIRISSSKGLGSECTSRPMTLRIDQVVGV